MKTVGIDFLTWDFLISKIEVKFHEITGYVKTLRNKTEIRSVFYH